MVNAPNEPTTTYDEPEMPCPLCTKWAATPHCQSPTCNWLRCTVKDCGATIDPATGAAVRLPPHTDLQGGLAVACPVCAGTRRDVLGRLCGLCTRPGSV